MEAYAYASGINPKLCELYNSIPSQTAANAVVVLYGVGYRSAAAMSRVSITNGGGTVLRAGSRLTVYVF
jgi:hypothetical protein